MDSNTKGPGPTDHDNTTRQFEQAPAGRTRVVFRLYVAGSRPSSLKAIAQLKELCNKHLAGCHELEIIDIYQQPERIGEANIIAAPTLVKQLPLPVQRFIGDLSNTDKILLSLALRPEPDHGNPP
jgi:circadian clock protein KaiB